MKRKIALSMMILTLLSFTNLSVKKFYASNNQITELAKELTKTSKKNVPASNLIKQVKDTLLFFNGNEVTNLDIYNYNNSTYLPLRTIGDLLGANVNWHSQEGIAQVSLDNIQVEILNNTNVSVIKKEDNIEEVKITANSNGKTVDLPALNIKGNIYLPIRYISETFGINIDYTANHQKTGTKTIEIYKGNKPDINYVKDLLPVGIFRYKPSNVQATFWPADCAWVDPITKKFLFYSVYYDSHEPVTRLSEGLIAVQNGGLWGFMNKNGEIVIEPKYDIPEKARYFSEGLVPAGDFKNYGYMDKTGKLVIEKQFKNARPFKEGLAAVQDAKTGKWGYIDKTGKFVIPPKYGNDYSGAYDFSEGLACVYTYDEKRDVFKVEYIDKTGKTIIKDNDINYVLPDEDRSFGNGLAPKKTYNSKTDEHGQGYIDKTGKLVIKPQFEWAECFSEGLAPVQDKKTMLVGFIDPTGKLVIPYKYKIVYQGFKNGIAHVLDKDGYHMYIDKNGNEIILDLIEYEEAVVAIREGNAKFIGDEKDNVWRRHIDY